MDDGFTASDPARHLGESLRPVLYRLRSELGSPIAASRQASNPVDILSRHLNRLQQLGERLEVSIGRLNAEVLDNPGFDNPTLQRAAGRLADCIEELTDGWHEARSLRPDGAAAEMPALLAGTYLHVLNEIEEWLGRLVRAFADPAAELARQGRPLSGPAEITLALKLTGPPQLRRLRQWAQRQHPALELGFWGTAGLALLGAGLFSALFSGGDCDC